MGKVDLTHVDMDCGNIVAFTIDARSFYRASIVDKHMPVRAHKLTGKDIRSKKRQLQASEDGRKDRDVALAERRVGGQNMIHG